MSLCRLTAGALALAILATSLPAQVVGADLRASGFDAEAQPFAVLGPSDPRTPIGWLPYVIDEPGSYVVTKDLTGNARVRDSSADGRSCSAARKLSAADRQDT